MQAREFAVACKGLLTGSLFNSVGPLSFFVPKGMGNLCTDAGNRQYATTGLPKFAVKYG